MTNRNSPIEDVLTDLVPIIPAAGAAVWRIDASDKDNLQIIGALPSGEEYRITIPPKAEVVAALMACQPAAVLLVSVLGDAKNIQRITNGTQAVLSSLEKTVERTVKRNERMTKSLVELVMFLLDNPDNREEATKRLTAILEEKE